MSHDGRELDAPRYAGLWIRGLALLLDWLLICGVCFPVTRVVKGVWLMLPDDHRWNQGLFIFDPLCLYFLLGIIGYFVLLEGLFGATAGKSIVGIRVVGTEGERIGMAKSIVRERAAHCRWPARTQPRRHRADRYVAAQGAIR